MTLSGLKEVVFVYEDKQLVVKGDELKKWVENMDALIFWANLENNNHFVRNPVQYEQLDMQGTVDVSNQNSDINPETIIQSADETTAPDVPIKKVKRANTK